MTSELLAEILDVFPYFKQYTDKNKYVDYQKDELDELNQLNFKFNKIFDEQPAEIKEAPGRKQISNIITYDILPPGSYEIYDFIIPYDGYNPSAGMFTEAYVSDFWLEIQPNDFNNDIIDELLEYEIVLQTGGSSITSVPMMINLFFANFANKKLYIDGDKIRIPIQILEIMNNLPFGLHWCFYHQLSIKLQPSNRHKNYNFNSEMNLCYKYATGKTVDRSNDILMEFVILQMKQKDLWVMNNRLSLDCKLVNKFIIFEFKPPKEYLGTYDWGTHDFVNIESIKLHLNGLPPIVFNDIEDEIIHFNIRGRHFYGISLCSEFKNIESINKYFSCKTRAKNLKLNSGINFSRIDKIVVEFNADYDLNGVVCVVYNINLNVARLMSGMCGTAYS